MKPVPDDPTLSIRPTQHSTDASSAKPATPFSPGEAFGPYRILRLLGQGGMGAVYEAEQIENGRRIALKVLTQTLPLPADRERFLREGRLAAAVSHPHSIYIYGTDEIQGTAVIAMELVSGGTLRDCVQAKGPMTTADAVDGILQIISGLKAAESMGVLHRDIKPSNCFVAADGSIKIGDFGLSVSTQARQETQLTLAGTILGTPAFASPEQLRGEELDVRSDIYSVGATLYFLLTGRPPFEEERIVQLLTTVLERNPVSPRDLRATIPKGLAAVVLRCLKKERSARCPGYSALEQELVPYSSLSVTPATLGLRSIAGIIDAIVVMLPGFAYFFYRGFEAIQNPDEQIMLHAGLFPFIILYYTLLEGIWGSSLGKTLCGLRVIGLDKDTVGIARALVRSLVFQIIESSPGWFMVALNMFQIADFQSNLAWMIPSFGSIGAILLLFSTARRRNGYAGIHELVSKTRVVHRSVYESRPMVRTREPAAALKTTAARIGPYEVISTLSKSETSELILGFDERLRRKVWIQLVPSGTPPVLVSRCDLSRPGRLHWLNGRRTPEECWDAYEAPDGGPLVTMIENRTSWHVIRHWLLDLAEELNAALKDRTIPPLGLDRLWSTSDGRLILLEFPAPATQPSIIAAVPNLSAAMAFLDEVARTVWGRDAPAGYPAVASPAGASPRNVLPIYAARFLEQLRDRSFETLEAVAGELRILVRENANVTRRRRLAHLAICSLLPLIAMAMASMGQLFMQKQATLHPDVRPLQLLLREFERVQLEWDLDPKERARRALPNAYFDSLGRRRQALEIYIASRFGKTIPDRAFWSSQIASILLSPSHRKTASEILFRHPHPSEAELSQATLELKQFLESIQRRVNFPLESRFQIAMFAIGASLACILSLALAMIFPGGLLFRFLGIAVVSRHGTLVSRFRGFWRTLMAWFPILLINPLCAELGIPSKILTHPGYTVPLICLFFAGALWAIWNPARGIQDRLAQTFLVPGELRIKK